jgi:hypothetical protein
MQALPIIASISGTQSTTDMLAGEMPIHQMDMRHIFNLVIDFSLRLDEIDCALILIFLPVCVLYVMFRH